MDYCCCRVEEINGLIVDIKRESENLSIFDIENISVFGIDVSSRPTTNSTYLKTVCKFNTSWKKHNINPNNRISWDELIPLNVRDKKGIYIVVSCQEIKLNTLILEPSIVYIGGQREGTQSLFDRVKKIPQILANKGAEHPFAKKLINIFETFYEDRKEELSFIIILLPLNNGFERHIEKVEGCFHYIYSHTNPKCPYFVFVDNKPSHDFNIFQDEREAKETIKSILSKIEEILNNCEKGFMKKIKYLLRRCLNES